MSVHCKIPAGTTAANDVDESQVRNTAFARCITLTEPELIISGTAIRSSSPSEPACSGSSAETTPSVASGSFGVMISDIGGRSRRVSVGGGRFEGGTSVDARKVVADRPTNRGRPEPLLLQLALLLLQPALNRIVSQRPMTNDR